MVRNWMMAVYVSISWSWGTRSARTVVRKRVKAAWLASVGAMKERGPFISLLERLVLRTFSSVRRQMAALVK